MLNRNPVLQFISILAVFFQFNCSNDSSATEPIEPPVEKKIFYRGTTMGFVSHQETYGNVVFKENSVATDPFKSIYNHGGNIVRFRVDLPPYKNSYTAGKPDVDFRSPEKVKSGLQRAKNAGLKTLLTFSYQSMALDAGQHLNDYVAPLKWQGIANNTQKLKDSVYKHTSSVLESYIKSGLIPEIVSIGNETNWRILEQNMAENNLPAYSAARTVTLLNAGSKAVRDLNNKYGLNIQIAHHIFGASNLKWWLNEHMPFGLDFDIMALSHYHGWHTLGDFGSWAEVVRWVKNTHKKDFLMLETAQIFTSGGNDAHVDILGVENIPNGYPNPPTTVTQKKYLKNFGQELFNAGGIGLIVWGGEWVGSNCLIYPDQWGAGSSWENKSFWDFTHNLHDGVNWMNEIVTE